MVKMGILTIAKIDAIVAAVGAHTSFNNATSRCSPRLTPRVAATFFWKSIRGGCTSASLDVVGKADAAVSRFVREPLALRCKLLLTASQSGFKPRFETALC